MCSTCEPIVLTEYGNGQISWCKRCKGYSLVFNSCCLSLTHYELVEFRDILGELADEDFTYEVNGKYHVIIQNPRYNIGLCLKPRQVETLRSMIQEAIAVNEVFSIIYNT
ncbi:MAG: DUF6686 family protein [Bacteroidota bacterium]